jgi:hypothetical protein
MVHIPVEQSPVPWAGAQGVSQSPQWVRVFVICSQPGTVSQSASPMAQPVSTQDPEAQDVLPPGRLHMTPQPAQSVLVRSDVSQPLDASMSQSS